MHLSNMTRFFLIPEGRCSELCLLKQLEGSHVGCCHLNAIARELKDTVPCDMHWTEHSAAWPGAFNVRTTVFEYGLPHKQHMIAARVKRCCTQMASSLLSRINHTWRWSQQVKREIIIYKGPCDDVWPGNLVSR